MDVAAPHVVEGVVDVVVREADLADVGGIVGLWAPWAAQEYPRHTPDELAMAVYLEGILTTLGGRTILVAEAGDEVVGYLLAVIGQEPAWGCLVLRFLAIQLHEDYQGDGIGDVMTQTALHIGDKCGCARWTAMGGWMEAFMVRHGIEPDERLQACSGAMPKHLMSGKELQ